MPRVSAAFFAIGVLCLLAGMTLGMYMGSNENFTLAPAHAHLNLLGWVTMSLYGTFYALARESYCPRLAWTNFIVSTLGVAVMIPSLAYYLASGNDPKVAPSIAIGGAISMLGLLVFGVSVVRQLLRKPA